ncbi:hypothetical protein [Hallella absiana]|uniref:hypothetical protein n=1 Tax=Hallella absiana TaxID=2925336 RepID=UPI0021C586E8|nr:hypothetical protein [Hallella absiana]
MQKERLWTSGHEHPTHPFLAPRLGYLRRHWSTTSVLSYAYFDIIGGPLPFDDSYHLKSFLFDRKVKTKK